MNTTTNATVATAFATIATASLNTVESISSFDLSMRESATEILHAMHEEINSFKALRLLFEQSYNLDPNYIHLAGQELLACRRLVDEVSTEFLKLAETLRGMNQFGTAMVMLEYKKALKSLKASLDGYLEKLITIEKEATKTLVAMYSI